MFFFFSNLESERAVSFIAAQLTQKVFCFTLDVCSNHDLGCLRVPAAVTRLAHTLIRSN